MIVLPTCRRYLRTVGERLIDNAVKGARIDPVLRFEKAGDAPMILDEGGDGDTEATPLMNVTAGTYYIKVSNIKDYPDEITGEYKLTIAYRQIPVDENEPNNRPYQGGVLPQDVWLNGLVEDASDNDWFQIRLSQEQRVILNMVPVFQNISHPMTYRLMNSDWKSVSSGELGGTVQRTGETTLNRLLPAGTYYLQIHAPQAIEQSAYKLMLHIAPVN